MKPRGPMSPWSPLLPFVRKLNKIVSVSENGEISEDDWWEIVSLYHPVSLFILEIWKIKNLLESDFFDNLTNPLMFEVTLLIVVIKLVIVVVEILEVSSMYKLVEVFNCELLSLNLPLPGSASVVVDKSAIYSNVAPPKLPDLPWNPWYPVYPCIPVNPWWPVNPCAPVYPWKPV